MVDRIALNAMVATTVRSTPRQRTQVQLSVNSVAPGDRLLKREVPLALHAKRDSSKTWRRRIVTLAQLAGRNQTRIRITACCVEKIWKREKAPPRVKLPKRKKTTKNGREKQTASSAISGNSDLPCRTAHARFAVPASIRMARGSAHASTAQ